MQETAAVGGLAIIHAENDAIINELHRQNAAMGRVGAHANATARPAAMEGEAVTSRPRNGSRRGRADADLSPHDRRAVRELEAARGRGQAIFGEACLAYLVLGEEALDDPVSGTAFDSARRYAAPSTAQRCGTA